MKLSTQAQALQAAIYNWFKGNCFKDLKYLTEHWKKFTINVL